MHCKAECVHFSSTPYDMTLRCVSKLRSHLISVYIVHVCSQSIRIVYLHCQQNLYQTVCFIPIDHVMRSHLISVYIVHV